jgi:hypothetical protein
MQRIRHRTVSARTVLQSTEPILKTFEICMRVTVPPRLGD